MAHPQLCEDIRNITFSLQNTWTDPVNTKEICLTPREEAGIVVPQKKHWAGSPPASLSPLSDSGPGMAGCRAKKLLKFNSNKTKQKNHRSYYQYSGQLLGPNCRKFGLASQQVATHHFFLTPREACFHRSPDTCSTILPADDFPCQAYSVFLLISPAHGFA